MTDFEFFTNQIAFQDLSVITIFDSLQAQNQYFEQAAKTIKQGIFKAFNQPILIHESLETCLRFNYFRFKRNDTWYYGVVTDVKEDTPNKCWVSYRLDYWQTARYQFGARLGRGVATRSSLVEPCATPYNAKYHKYSKHQHLSWRNISYNVIPDIVFFVRRHNSNECRIGYIGGASTFTSEEIKHILNGDWVEFLRPLESGQPYFKASDVTGAWFTPPLIDTSNEELVHTGWAQMPGRDGLFSNKAIISVFPSDSSEVYGFGNLVYTLPKSIVKDFVTNNTKTTVVKDLEGNIVYQFDYARDYNVDLHFRLSVSPTSAKWIVCTDPATLQRHNPIEFTFPCSSLDMFVDSYAEYFARDRDFDVSTRELNNKKDLASSAVSVGTSAVSGALTGALVGAAGGPIGAAGGALLGGLGSVIGAAFNYGTESYFNPQEQAIKDNYYKNAVDPLAIVGSNLFTFIFDGSKYCGLFEYEVDDDTKARITSDITEYGQYTTKATASGEQFIAHNARLKGEFIILGNLPESWKGEIQRRIASGVTIIKLGA